ncbi:MAG TPA: metal-dependent hydrolase [Rhodanobacter sp.]
MPTIFTHAAIPLLLGAAAGKRRVSHPLLFAGILAAMLPDADVLGFRFGIAYADAFGHRGAAHSIAFAVLLALLAALLHGPLRSPPWRAFGFVGLAALSHPLLDACTNGGLGVALWWPFDTHRFFFPWRPIEVSPIGARFFSARGWLAIQSELVWAWLPMAAIALLLWQWRLRLDGRSGRI